MHEDVEVGFAYPDYVDDEWEKVTDYYEEI